MDWLKDAFNVVIQLIIGATACGIGFAVPLSAADGDGLGDSGIGMGVFGVLSGLVIGVVAPQYFDAQGWWVVVLVLLGGALFFSLGVAGLAWARWGLAGASVGLLGFVATMHYTAIAYESTVGPNPILLKLGVIAGLCGISFLLAVSFSTHARHHGSASLLIERRVVSWIGAVLTLLEFFNIVFGLWEKYLQ